MHIFSSHNYIHHGKNWLCQNVEDGYIFVNNFVKKSDHLTNHFYGTLLSKHTVNIDPTSKPVISIQSLEYFLYYA